MRKRVRVTWAQRLLLSLTGAALAAVLVLLGAYCGVLRLPESLQERVDLLPDVNARSGTPNAGAAEPLEAGSFQVVINRLPTVAAGSRECTLWAENPESNPHDLLVRLYLDETGELLGATHRIQRGKRVDTLRLTRVPAPGEYPVTAELELYDEAQAPAGSFSLRLTLRVLE